ncbi:pilus assembly protein PilP [Psychrosphaera haliotis]|uniref:Pilus assembly protein PilP n=1 Tax=Psychrosphaera haliotis TaxID=555083 RepID=A0A6N8F9D4_9GAMM|nr:pilus assembly protein PilP [Psychrosphaera haliotis]MUH73136.1 pilus assembly protein PilP [Psychrosphaera haliotis]
MSRVVLLILSLFLVACNDDVSDIQQYMNKIKSGTPVKIEPIPAVNQFQHIDYSMISRRSPFDLPSPEVIQENYEPAQNCLAPDPRRRKQPLEKFALDNLSMRGTLGTDKEVWALIQASDGSLHRVTEGNFVGLYNGRITSVSDNRVILVELIPDGAGCWKERTARVQLADSSVNE